MFAACAEEVRFPHKASFPPGCGSLFPIQAKWKIAAEYVPRSVSDQFTTIEPKFFDLVLERLKASGRGRDFFVHLVAPINYHRKVLLDLRGNPLPPPPPQSNAAEITTSSSKVAQESNKTAAAGSFKVSVHQKDVDSDQEDEGDFDFMAEEIPSVSVDSNSDMGTSSVLREQPQEEEVWSAFLRLSHLLAT